jgi:DNA-binding PadR family transcriptional regulator
MRKLSNDELATRTREANRRRGERARERLTIAGRAALTVWLPVGLRSRFVAEAASCGVNISELATRLIEKGLREKSVLNTEFNGASSGYLAHF